MVLGQSLTSCPRIMEGQSPEHLEEWTAPLPTLLPSPLYSLLGAHMGPWLPGPTSSLCVLREDQEQDVATISTAGLKCHTDWSPRDWR